eukprot:6178010-Pleurochrysis_carterae.AAC.1
MGISNLWKPLKHAKTAVNLFNGELQGWRVAVDASVLLHGVVGQGSNAVAQKIHKVAVPTNCLTHIKDLF